MSLILCLPMPLLGRDDDRRRRLLDDLNECRLAEDSRQSLWSPANRVGVDQRSNPGRRWLGYYYCY